MMNDLTCGFLDVKPNFLVALSNILQYMPAKVVILLLRTFLPLLFESLSLEEADVKVASINTISATFIDASDLMVEHLPSLVEELLKSSILGTSGSPMRVRLAALNCLSMLPRCVKPETLEPFRKQITNKLTVVLDDPKRDVRKAAVDCRQLYFSIDS